MQRIARGPGRRGWPLIVATLLASCGQPPLPADTPSNSTGIAGSAANQMAASTDQCAAPANWSAVVPEAGTRNTASIDLAGAIRWNGTEVDAVRLRQYLDITGTMAPTPHLIVQVEPGAPCARVTEVLDVVARSTLNCATSCTYRAGSSAAPASGNAAAAAPAASNQGLGGVVSNRQN